LDAAFREIIVTTVYDFTVDDIGGHPVKLDRYKGKVLLVVNTASKCGFTPQYKGLEALYRKYKDQGLEVLGFPCNQFGAQEPGSAEDIQTFCSRNYGVSFPMFAKVEVNGHQATITNQHAGVADWQIMLDESPKQVSAQATDQAGNVEKTPAIAK
jgi:glutathione peroxidase